MKSIYFFEDGNKDMHYLLGNKGANLCEMYNLGLPVPYGFILSTHSNKLTDELLEEIKFIVSQFEGILGKDLFFSVRSSPIFSMPGMMDSVLNVDSYEDLFNAIDTVLNSWNNKRAMIYRENHSIPDELGTAIIIQKMVFGNKNENSGSGVIFSSNPNNNEKNIMGEILFEAQGEDIVLGRVTPQSIQELKNKSYRTYKKLEKISKKLENHFSEVQEIEFTIEDEKLYILQTRNIKRKKELTLYKIKNKPIEYLFKGTPSSYGVATGRVVFDSEKAVELKQNGENVILVRPETSPEDIEGIIACDGIITLTGGITSHAAVVSRSMGKPCICDCNGIQLNELDWITIDGKTGEIFLGKKELISEKITFLNINLFNKKV